MTRRTTDDVTARRVVNPTSPYRTISPSAVPGAEAGDDADTCIGVAAICIAAALALLRRQSSVGSVPGSASG